MPARETALPASTPSVSPRELASHAHRRSSDDLSLSARFTLAFGFGGLLAIMAVAGFDEIRMLRQIRRSDNQIRRQFLAENHVLNDVRSELYLSGTYVRDYLLDPDPERAETHRAHLEEVRREMDSAMTSYGGESDAAQAAHYAELAAELSRYWNTLGPILQWSPGQRRTDGYAFLRDQVYPRRTAMLELASRIEKINEQQLDEGNRRVDGLMSAFQDRLAITLLAALLLGLGTAVFSTQKIMRLAAEAQAQYREVVEARGQLKELSARLVQAQESERRSLSRELHDEVGQSLSAVLVELRNLSSELGTPLAEQASSHLASMKNLVENSVRVVRNMALLLRPSMLDDLGLIPALRWQAREVSKRTSMDVSVATELGSDELPDSYKTCIYRVVQEALNNCARHSEAKTVRIRIRQEPDRLALSVQDDGQGFDASQSKGLGLLGIQERVASLGGECRIHSEPGNGTILAVELPWQNGAGH
ncbi:MAG TPA: ATP-binding protein [Terriglobia bacterium]|nr:ATP-binding protein [Terriglobia bacterium]